MSLFDTLLGRPSRPSEAALESSLLLSEADHVHHYKTMAIERAMDTAAQEGRAPTMSHYYLAAEEIGALHSEAMDAKGISWGPQVYADARNLTFDGFLIRQHEIEPTEEMQRYAMLHASSLSNGAEPTTSQLIASIQHINDQMVDGELTNKMKETLDQKKDALVEIQDMYDLDGNGEINVKPVNQFYAAVANQTNFEGTDFTNVTFHPAGTLTQFHSEGASCTNVTFDGMSGIADERGEIDCVRLAKGKYENIKFTNITGGLIDVAEHAEINGMDISGQTAQLTIGSHARVTNLNAQHAHVISIQADENAHIQHSSFNGATIDMASNVKGSMWHNVTFNESNLGYVELDGAKLSHVSFTNTDLTNLSLNGATLINVKIDGKAITHVDQLKALGIAADDKTSVQAHSAFIAQAEAAAKDQAIQDQIKLAMKNVDLSTNNKLGESETLQKQEIVLSQAAPEPVTQSHSGLFDGPTHANMEAMRFPTPKPEEVAPGASPEVAMKIADQLGGVIRAMADSWNSPIVQPALPSEQQQVAASRDNAIPANYYSANQGRVSTQSS